ncbi:Calmodulin [Hexamita inflata]|uniref:Calmodulin n=1 Tax=Hexamita inflata TaxID=28002 RepID=A0AA86P765_9EUKA|nr:Calmodulin [Hexamita inflata]
MFKKFQKWLKDMNDPEIEENNEQPSHEFFMTAKSKDDPIETIEMHWVLRNYFPNVPQRCAIALAKLIDENNDGAIQRSEFNHLLLSFKNITDDEDILNIFFAAADKDNSQSLDEHEMQIIKDKLRLDFEVPKNKLSLNEFKTFMRPFTGQITGAELVPYTDELNEYLNQEGVMIEKVKGKVEGIFKKMRKQKKEAVKEEAKEEPKIENQMNQSSSNIKNIAKQEDGVFQQAKSL